MSDNFTIEEKLVNELIYKNYTITTAESCTGGMIASRIVNVSGASSVLNEAVVTYSEDAKMKYLNVDYDIIKEYTVVSEIVAKQMAIGAARNANSDIAISVTGIAGPLGGSEDKPVGLVYIGCYYNGVCVSERNIFKGDRLSVRIQATDRALNLAYNCITKKKDNSI